MLVGARTDGNISIWDTGTGELDRQLSHGASLNAVDGNSEFFATAGDDNTTKLWTIDYLSTTSPIAEIPDSAPVVDVSVSLNNGIMTLNAAGSAKLYSYAAGKGVEEVLVYPGVASAVGFSPDSKFLASASFDSKMRVYALSGGW